MPVRKQGEFLFWNRFVAVTGNIYQCSDYCFGKVCVTDELAGSQPLLLMVSFQKVETRRSLLNSPS